MKTNKFLKYLLPSFILYFTSCSSGTGQLSQVDNSISATGFYDLNLGPKGGGTIDPKITSGQSIVNFKEGDSVLVFNLNLKSNKAFSTKETKTNGNVITVTPSIAPVTTPTPTASPTQTPNNISKIYNQIYINERKYTLEISSDKITDNKYTINLAGLKKGSIVSFSSEAFDSNNTSVGKETISNKQVKEDVELVDLNISVNIEINISQKTEVNTSVNVSQSQVVSPIINITLPSQPSPPSNTPLPPPPRRENQR